MDTLTSLPGELAGPDGDGAPETAARYFPLSPEQRQIWLHAALSPDPALYNEQLMIRRAGRLDPAAMARALETLIRRHEALRMHFLAVGGDFVQTVGPVPVIDVPVTNLGEIPHAQREAEAVRIAAAEARRPFDLENGPLLRAAVVRMGEDDWRLCLTVHHLVIDALAFNRVLLPEIAALYTEFAGGKPAGLAPLSMHFADYAVGRQRQIAGKPIASRTKWWGRTLSGAPGTVPLPYDRQRPAAPNHRGGVEIVEIPAELARALNRLSAAHGVTLYMTLLAGFGAVLYRYTGQDDILVAGVASTRRRPGLDKLIGCFSNIVPLRTRPRGGLSFSDHLDQTREMVMAALVAGEVPFDAIVREAQPQRDAAIFPLVQTMLSLETAEAALPPGWQVEYLDGSSGTSKFDISISLHERRGRIAGRLVYSAELFDAATMRRLVGHWMNLLAAAAADPDCPLDRLPLMDDAEQRQALVAFNDTQQDYPNASLTEMFAAQAARSPDATAVVFGERSWNYRELAAAVDRIAGHLRAAGVGRGDIVALAVERSFEMIAGIFAILKAGAAYIPLDPAFPAARLALMLDDAQPKVVLTQRALVTRLPQVSARILPLEDCAEPTGAAVDFPAVGADDIAYVLYTSGSTGKPNGVVVPQRCVVNLLTWFKREFEFRAGDGMLAVATLSFDMAVPDIFLPLIEGGHIVVADRDTVLDPHRLGALIDQSGCTLIQATPAIWRSLAEAGWTGGPGLKLVAGGEVLVRELAERLTAGGARMWNGYGPTETTVYTTMHPVTPGGGSVPIGRPIGNVKVYILDPAGNPVPIGIPGEVHIGGTGVTNGYLNRPELTAQRFLSDPFATVPGARMYRTGDIARWLPDGSVNYLGRADRQVKIRGIRIEPGEIETALIAHKAVRQAAVAARTETPGDQRLAAYLVAEDGAERPGLAELRAHVAAQLPSYMVPNAFVWLDALPLTPSGKMDRKALPAPDMRAAPQPEEGFVPPTGECEEKLAAIWRDLLGIERIGATDDFFALGGHSLLVLPMRARIERVFGRRLAISAIFYGPSIRLIAALLSEEAGAALPTVAFQANGSRPPLYWIDPGPIMTPLAQALGPDQPFLGLMFNTVVTDDANQPNRIADIAPYLVENLRKAQPRGPYYIGGWCADGLLAFDIASRLIAEGETVGLLVLLHAGNPVHFRRHSKAAVKFSMFKHQLRLLSRMRHKELRDFAAERAKRLFARISPKPNVTAPAGHYFDGIIDRTAMHYEPKPYAGDAVLFQPIDRPQVFDHRAGWAEIVQGELLDFDIPGGHHTMLYEPNVQELAARLAECLERAQAKHGSATA